MLLREVYEGRFKVPNEEIVLSQMLVGNMIRDDYESIENIVRLEKQGYNQILARVESQELRGPFKKGSYLLEAVVYDGTMAMTVKIFLQEEMKLKIGGYYAIAGNVEIDKFYKKSEEYIMMMDTICVWDFEEDEITDDAEVKRVELSTVGSYSQLISPTTGSDYVKRAHQLGHKAVAITDINAVQGFPEAYKTAKELDMKLLLGMKLNVVDDTMPIVYNANDNNIYEQDYTVYDVETTGFSVVDEYVIEIGATRFNSKGEVVASFQHFIKPPKPIPAHITDLTSITQEEIDNEGRDLESVIEEFHQFWQGSVLVAHNAHFDRDHLFVSYERCGREKPVLTMVDTLLISRMINTDLKTHNLKKLSSKYKVTLNSHHRADQDAQATGEIFFHMLEQLKEMDIQTFNDINKQLMVHGYHTSFFSGDCTIIAKNQAGLVSLYEVVSLAHSDFIGRTPMMPLSELQKHRENLIIGSGSEDSRIFDLALNKPIEQVREMAKFFDYIEIEPTEIASNMVLTHKVESENSIRRAWKTLIQVAKELGKPIIATGYTHYLDKEDRLPQHILMYNELAGRKHHARRGHDEDIYGYRHFRTTQEMMDGLDYIEDEKEKYEYVVTNSNKVADMCDKIQPIPDNLFPPDVPDADDRLDREAREKAHSIYGNPLPPYIQERLDRELNSIISHGYAVIYTISADLVRKSNSDGYLVGSRGSVGSSFAATMMGITEVNPLKPHYGCKDCHWSIFFDNEEIQSGYDLPLEFAQFFKSDMYKETTRKYFVEQFAEQFGAEEAMRIIKENPKGVCPKCGGDHMFKDGQDIPFETFLGFKGDKVPDIDLNFSGEYQSKAHGFVGENKEAFGLSEVYRAGTIGTVAEKTAIGYAKKYQEEHELLGKEGYNWTFAEVKRLANKIVGAKKTTGQHAGGIIVVPRGQTLNNFGGSQYPANKLDAQYKTTHYAFEFIHDSLCKLDILGHDDPTILRLLRDSTGIDPTTIDPTDPKVLKLFYEPETALEIDIGLLKAKTGTLSVPEFGTEFVQQMILDTKPKTFAELVKISGLSHGTDVWLNNAQDLIRDNVCEFKEIIGCRDDIMVYLAQKGLENSLAFKIMEHVRKGKGLTEEMEVEMRANDVPEWYIESCRKIKYMFPKAHAAAYVTSALRIAYFKVYYPIHYYAALISVRKPDLDVREVIKSADQIWGRMEELEAAIAQKKKSGQAITVENDTLTYLKTVHEAIIRGIKFEAINIFKSSSNRWKIDGDKILPPFLSVPALGGEAAIKAEKSQKDGIYRGIDDFKARSTASKNAIQVMKEMGCFELIETIETKFF